MRIYPAIDLKGGRVVRLTQGLADQETVYFPDPLMPAKDWQAAGTEWLHVVDLDGAFTGQPAHLEQLKAVLALGLKVELGGGLRTREVVAEVLAAGVQRAIIGTRAATDPDFVRALVEVHGGERIAVGIDAKDGKVAVKGWVETSAVSALELAQQVAEMGVQTIIYTDISRDGMLTGPNFAAQKEMLQTVGANLIASGGVARLSDVEQFASLARRYANLDGVIIGKALYDGQFTLAEALRLV